MTIDATSPRIAPEFAAPLGMLLQMLPGGLNAAPDIAGRRQTMEALVGALAASTPPVEGVATEDRTIPGHESDAAVGVRIFRPDGMPDRAPGIVHVHGGGMVMGTVDGEAAVCAALAVGLGCVVVSVDYRLAPEHPYPAGLRDCYAALRWVHDTTGDLGVDPDRIALYGGSGGGNLVLATALMARDAGGPAIRFVMAPYPMIDDRNETPSSHEITGIGIWDRAATQDAWGWYLGGQEADGYAAPARMEDLRGLPPTFIDVGDLDVFRDEDVAFAARLLQAGVPTELHVYPGAFHAAEAFAPDAPAGQTIVGARFAALQRALTG